MSKNYNEILEQEAHQRYHQRCHGDCAYCLDQEMYRMANNRIVREIINPYGRNYPAGYVPE